MRILYPGWIRIGKEKTDNSILQRATKTKIRPIEAERKCIMD